MSQDDELALMAGYAAAMDASMSESTSTQDVTTAIASGTSSPPEEEEEPQEGPSGMGRPQEDWDSQTAEELDHTSLSMCVSEATCKKNRGNRSLMKKKKKVHKAHVTVGIVTLAYRKKFTLYLFKNST